MAHGGRRNGSGRKKGEATKKTRKIADEAAADGQPLPLEVLLFCMRKAYAAKDYKEAAGYARDAAVYCHPRLSAVKLDGKVGVVMEVVEEMVDAPDGEASQAQGDPPAPGPA